MKVTASPAGILIENDLEALELFLLVVRWFEWSHLDDSRTAQLIEYMSREWHKRVDPHPPTKI